MRHPHLMPNCAFFLGWVVSRVELVAGALRGSDWRGKGRRRRETGIPMANGRRVAVYSLRGSFQFWHDVFGSATPFRDGPFPLMELAVFGLRRLCCHFERFAAVHHEHLLDERRLEQLLLLVSSVQCFDQQRRVEQKRRKKRRRESGGR